MRMPWNLGGRAELRFREKRKKAQARKREARAEGRHGKRRLQDAPQGKQAGAAPAFARTFKGIVGNQDAVGRFKTLTEHSGGMSWDRKRRRRARHEAHGGK